MDASSTSRDTTELGTKDGLGASDHDQPYTFGRRPTSRAPYPFTTVQFARLLMQRGRVRDVSSAADQAED